MFFNIPKKKYMNEMAATVKKLYKLNVYKSLEKKGIRIFYITDKDESIILVVDCDAHKIDVFAGEAGFLSCHFLLSGDKRGIHSFGLTNYFIEECVMGESNYCGTNYYISNFKHHKVDTDLYVTYHIAKPGQRPIVLEEDEVINLNRYLKKFFIVFDEIKDNNQLFDEDTACVCDFSFDNKKCEIDYMPLDSLNFFPSLSFDDKEENMLSSLEQIEVKSGVMHIGMIYGFSEYDSYNDLTDFEVALCPIILYGLTEEGDMTFQIYSTPYKRREDIFNAIANIFFKEVGICDTIITDNLFVYDMLCSSLQRIGVEIKANYDDPFNIFITKFMIKMINLTEDVSILDEMLNSCKTDLKNLILDNLDDFDEFIERFFDEQNENLIIEEETEFDEENDFSEDDEGGYVS